MPFNTLSEQFEEYSSMDYYVGFFRNNDIRKFNYKASKNDPNLSGISSFVNFIQVENSVDFSYRVAQINIRDFADLRKTLGFTGNEIIYIEYNNKSAAEVSTSLSKYGFFRVIGSKETSDGATSGDSSSKHKTRNINLYLAEYPYFDILTFNGYNKTYKWSGGSATVPPIGAKSIEGLVSDMFLSPTNREVITTMGISYASDKSSDISPKDWINYYSPNWSLIKNINFLKRMASTLIGNYPFYFLNCEQDRIQFKSIYSEYLFPAKKLSRIDFVSPELYNLMPMFDISPPDPSNSLIDVTYDIGNCIDAVFSGFSGTTNFTFDFLKGHNFNSYDYRLFKQTSKSTGPYYLNHNKFGDQNSKGAYSPFTNPKHNENIQKYEFAKKSFNSMVATVTTYINNGRFLGQTANIVPPSSSPDTKALIDPILGQDWCLWGYKDVIIAGKGVSLITLKKDTTNVPYFGHSGSMIPT